MGIVMELALLISGTIFLYTLLHDLLGLHIISYYFFEFYIAPLFVASFFTFILGFASLFYWRKHKREFRKNLKGITTALLLLASGIYLTAIPIEASNTFLLIAGKVLIIAGIITGCLVSADKFHLKA